MKNNVDYREKIIFSFKKTAFARIQYALINKYGLSILFICFKNLNPSIYLQKVIKG
jgi:hypothetical protein